ncbi:molybdopterin molybdotransferase MoeA [Kocuria dechangensis]|uniref:molybdopterin molybdotransferase MoeA n=1 Tax=Kocuria dechangensis TaxID=1176249 RepID=UPI001662E69F|nr:gephyrin-like molybdotransferase Glp [Kocuria dechangensis]
MSRHAEHPVRSVEEHRRAVADVLRDLVPRTETVPLRRALGRVLARDLVAPLSLQPFDNSQMDGFAIRAADSRAAAGEGGSAAFVVVEPVPAGHVPGPLAPGRAAPIMTGAPLPPGADAVVPVEEALPRAYPVPGATVRLPAGQRPGRFVRRAGEDVAQGDPALRAGQRLTPARIGLAAALGVAELAVRARPRAVVYSTGDEVVAPGAERGPAQIYDANAAILRAQLEEAGVEVVGAHLVPDDAEAFTARLAADAALAPDLFVSSGGVSEGAYEVVRQVLEPGGAFVHVAVQPGGPQGVALAHGVPFLCLPGNPVSALVSFEMFVRPALTEVVGAPAARASLTGPLAQAARPLPTRTQVRRALWDGTTVRMAGGPGSHLLAAAARANALAVLPPGDAELPAGTPVEVLLLD